MKLRLAVPVIIAILFTACKKGVVEPTTAPVNRDTTTDVIPKDTSTLLKTSSIYNFASDGTTITDSSLSRWTYDNQRRIVQQTFEGAGYDVTFSYTYLNDRYTYSSVSNYNGSLVLKSDVTFFQHLDGQTDSIFSSSTGYGVQAGYVSKGIQYFYYNQARQDTLEKNYDITSDTPKLFSVLNKFYTGSSLDSAIYHDGQGNLTSISYFTGGNPTSSSIFSNNIQSSASYSTYSDTTSGGLFMVYGTTKLRTRFTNVVIPGTTNYLETNTYTFDSADRVVSVMRDHHGYSTNQKEIYTWY